jgi:adenylate cyclase
MFAKARIGLNLVYPVFTVAAIYTMLTLYRYLTEERERRRIKDDFQHDVAPDVIQLMLENPAGVRLGGRTKS